MKFLKIKTQFFPSILKTLKWPGTPSAISLISACMFTLIGCNLDTPTADAGSNGEPIMNSIQLAAANRGGLNAGSSLYPNFAEVEINKEGSPDIRAFGNLKRPILPEYRITSITWQKGAAKIKLEVEGRIAAMLPVASLIGREALKYSYNFNFSDSQAVPAIAIKRSGNGQAILPYSYTGIRSIIYIPAPKIPYLFVEGQIKPNPINVSFRLIPNPKYRTTGLSHIDNHSEFGLTHFRRTPLYENEVYNIIDSKGPGCLGSDGLVKKSHCYLSSGKWSFKKSLWYIGNKIPFQVRSIAKPGYCMSSASITKLAKCEYAGTVFFDSEPTTTVFQVGVFKDLLPKSIANPRKWSLQLDHPIL